MKLKSRFLGLLSLLGIRDSATVRTVTKGDQAFAGTKTLSDPATSPNSKDDIDSMPATEVLTHKAMTEHIRDKVKPPLDFISVPSFDVPAPKNEYEEYEFERHPDWNILLPPYNIGPGEHTVKFRAVFPASGGSAFIPGPGSSPTMVKEERFSIEISVPEDAPASPVYAAWPLGTKVLNGSDVPWEGVFFGLDLEYGTMIYVAWWLMPMVGSGELLYY